MAARKRSGTKDSPWPERTRERIKTSMLLNRLMLLAEGKVEMPPHAVTAALGLLRKVMPDLSAQELSGGVASYVARLPQPAKDASSWLEAQGRPQTAEAKPLAPDTKH